MDQKQLLVFYKNKKLILEKSQDFFANSSSVKIKIGTEIEFFLLDENLQPLENQDFLSQNISELKEILLQKFSLIYEVEKEKGKSQIEVKTKFTDDLRALCFQLEEAKEFIKNFFAQKKLIASFDSQIFEDDCGNSLQFNISLHDENDQNLFEFDKKILNHVAQNLLDSTDFMMVFLCPNEEDYLRFSYEINRNLFKQGKFTAPVNLSYGGDNRSCAIRIPQITKTNGKRLEYRIACANCDIFLSISAILISLNHGLKNYGEPSKINIEQIFGNAFEEKYEVRNFCKNLQDATENFFSEENFVRKKFLEFI